MPHKKFLQNVKKLVHNYIKLKNIVDVNKDNITMNPTKPNNTSNTSNATIETIDETVNTLEELTGDGPNEFTELLKCYKCDCIGKPYCNIKGELCDECFDYKHFCHRKPRSKFPGTFLKVKCSFDRCKKTAVYKNNKKTFYVVRGPGDGDCLYTAISNAMGGTISVKDLRRLISRKQTNDMYKAYVELSKTTNEFQVVQQVNSFAQYRHLIQLCGSEVGPDQCIWGDENALSIISNEFGFTFVIFNEKGNVIQTITPSHNGDTCDNTNDVTNNKQCNKHAKCTVCVKRFVLLRLCGTDNNEGHYDLLKFNGHSILSSAMWNYLNDITSTA